MQVFSKNIFISFATKTSIFLLILLRCERKGKMTGEIKGGIKGGMTDI